MRRSLVKKKAERPGFTLVEVMLVLAITGLMFAGLVANTHRNIASQRYSTSVQDFTNLLRQVYNEVENSQISLRGSTTRKHCTIEAHDSSILANDATSGRSNCSVYGKLITFGENDGAIHVYDVLGEAIDIKNNVTGSDDKEVLKKVYIGVLAVEDGELVAAGAYYSHSLEWGAWVEYEDGDNFVGSLLIVRSPLNGLVHTYINTTNNNVQISSELGAPVLSEQKAKNNLSGNAALLTTNMDNFSEAGVNFCIESDDRRTQARRNVRITQGASNSSNIILIDQDGGDNKC